VYAGHAALALLAKSKRRAIPIALLVPVAFAPDWIKVLLSYLGHENRELSHSLVSVGICATVVALAYYAYARVAADAFVLWLTYVSHWPADYITGMKQTWPGGPQVGLLLYAHPLWDAIVESALIVVCYAVYRRSLPETSRKRAIGWLIPLGLIGMQILFVAIQSPDFG
jgi:membrane-bound metal-dependent hydrolase YbcI (DUF457 family)